MVRLLPVVLVRVLVTHLGSANNTDASVGLHQAYFTLKNFLGAPVDAKIGRQEIMLDGWRLFGNTIWTAGMQVHDAMTFQP